MDSVAPVKIDQALIEFRCDLKEMTEEIAKRCVKISGKQNLHEHYRLLTYDSLIPHISWCFDNVQRVSSGEEFEKILNRITAEILAL